MTDPNRPTPLSEALRALPEVAPPPAAWGRLEQQLDARSGARRGEPSLRALLATAAVILAVLGAITYLPTPPPPVPGGNDLAALMARSAELEGQLGEARGHVDLWDGHSAREVAALQTGLQVIDLQLAAIDAHADPERARLLWRDRVALMDELVKTHRGSATAEADRRQTARQPGYTLETSL